MKTILKFVGYIVAFLLMAAGLIALVLYMFGLANGNTTGNIITTMPPVESATPAPDGNVSVETTQQNGTNSLTMATPTPFVATPTPAPENPDAAGEAAPTPTPTPEPTAAPTPTPEPDPAGLPLGGGTISSNTGAWIELDAVWNAETVDGERAKVTVTANLRSYRLQTGAKRNGLEITVDGQTSALDVDGLVIETQQEATTELGTYSFVINAPKGMLSAVPIEVTWHFGGTYSGKQLDTITVSDKVELDRTK